MFAGTNAENQGLSLEINMLTEQRSVRHERLQTERQKYKEMMTLVASSLQDAEDEDETARRIQRLHAQVPPCSELSVRVRRDTVACGGGVAARTGERSLWERDGQSAKTHLDC